MCGGCGFTNHVKIRRTLTQSQLIILVGMTSDNNGPTNSYHTDVNNCLRESTIVYTSSLLPHYSPSIYFCCLAFIFCLPWGRPCGNHAKRCINEDNSVLAKPLAVCIHYLQQFPSYSNRNCKKSPFSRTAAHIFVSPGVWDAPAIITQYVAWVERQFNACQTPRSIYLSIFNSFPVIRCLSQCVSPKIAIFTTFWFPLGQSR